MGTRRVWLRCLGVSSFSMIDWKSKRLYWSKPSKCTVCHRWQEPWDDNFVAVFGNVLKGEDGWLCWKSYNGLWVLPTGEGRDHYRFVCDRHGGKEGRELQDCITNETALLPPSSLWVELHWRLRNAVYYAWAAIKFPVMVAGYRISEYKLNKALSLKDERT